MSDRGGNIVYNFQENREGLDQIDKILQDLHEFSDSVNQLFQNLPDAMNGNVAPAVMDQHHVIDQKLRAVVDALTHVNVNANTEQDDMESLDHSLAQQASGLF